MQILELEEKYSELKSDLSGQLSKRTKLLKISGYLGFALSGSNPDLIEPYVIDLLPGFLKYSNDLEVRGLNPKQIEILKSQLNQIKKLNLNEIDSSEFESAVTSLDDKIHLMYNWLESDPPTEEQSKIYFPLLEKNDDELGSGYLETVSTIIKKGEQKYHISPADLENDEQLEKQIKLCFSKALEYCSHFIKNIKKSHTVYVYFENRLGILTGNSLGAALTLSFIEAILKHYNSPIVVNINKNLAITGGINQDSKIISTSKTIIEAKVETAFYSDVEIMCVPKIDEIWAEEKLKELQAEYPKRKLKIIGLTDLNDLLDRRQIVDIRKQKLIVRSGKFVKKNWISAFATVLLAILFAYLFAMDFDDNPAIFSLDGKYVHIKNKNGKELWKKYFFASDNQIKDIRYASNDIRIIDVNKDGIKEVLFSTKYNDKLTFEPLLICYDYKGYKKWDYKFEDIIFSERENLSNEFGYGIIDTINETNKNKVFIIANNIQSFASAIFCIDLKTGKRLAGTFWASGATIDASLVDIDDDKQKELVVLGWDNGYEDVVFYAKEIDTLTTVRKSIDSYTIKNFPLGKVINYVRIPKTDFENYYAKHRTPNIIGGTFCYLKYKKTFNFIMQTEDNNIYTGYGLNFNQRLELKEIIISSDFRVARDTLVAHHKLNPPYTDTKEYKEILMDNILYYKNGKWVNRKGEIKE